MKTGISNYAESVDSAFIFIVAISVIILLGVTAAMIYFVIRYSRKRNPVGTNIEGHFWLEVAWIAIPTLLVLAMFYVGYSNFNTLRRVPHDAMVVKVTGQMWKWSFQYENGKKYDTLYVPQGKPIKLELESIDVNHSFYIPAFRIKEDVVAGKKTYLVFNPDKIGTFDIACAEYCGLRHAYMYNKVHVIPSNEFVQWVNQKDSAGNAMAAAGGGQGSADVALLQQKGCFACHSTDGTKIVGPSFKQAKIGEKVTVITNGKEREVTIDEDYLRRSILEPNADVVKGYPQGVMPSQKGQLTDEELNNIIKLLKEI